MRDSPEARLEDVWAALEAVEPPGACAAIGVIQTAPPPGLAIPGLGAIGLPLTDRTAPQVLARCRQAPYGHREATIVDTSVRNTWELDAGEIVLENPAWTAELERIRVECLARLGVSRPQCVQAKLYKLLVYEAGGMFRRHQDTEKEPGMFATLVLVLPGAFAGGRLVVEPPHSQSSLHGNGKRSPIYWNPADENPWALKYAAFYADCHHEVEPVTSGYRVCLTYNLVTSDVHDPPRFAGNHQLMAALDRSLRRLLGLRKTGEKRNGSTPNHHETKRRKAIHDIGSDDDDGQEDEDDDEEEESEGEDNENDEDDDGEAERYVHVLEHKYTDGGLSFARLKNRDKIVAQCLAEFCHSTGGVYGLYLCKVTYNGYDEDYGGGPEDEDEQDEDLPNLMIEDPWLKYGTTEPVRLGSVCANLDTEVGPDGCFSGIKMDGCSTSDEDYYGNEGCYVTGWYKTAALVVCRTSREFVADATINFDRALKTLTHLIDTANPRATEFARLMFTKSSFHLYGSGLQYCYAQIQRLGDPELLMALIQHSKSYVTLQSGSGLPQAIDHIGWDKCAHKIFEWAKANLAFDERANFAKVLLREQEDPARIRSVLEGMCLKRPNPKSQTKAMSWNRRDEIPRPDGYSELLEIAYRGAPDLVTKLLTLPGLDPVEFSVPAFLGLLTNLNQSTNATAIPGPLVPTVLKLREKVETKTPSPGSWAFDHVLVVPHGDCHICRKMPSFLTSRSEAEIKLERVGAQADKHVREKIENHAQNLRIEVDRSKRPYSVLIRKLPVNDQKRMMCQNLIASLNAMLTPSLAAPVPPVANDKEPELILIDN